MTLDQLQTTLREFERESNRGKDDDIRRKYREERGLVYVKTHTIQAYFRKYRRRPRRKLAS